MLALYGWLNLILGMVYLGFRLSLRLNERLGRPISHSDFAWLGQFLLALALVAPFGIRLIPSERLPVTNFSFQQILVDTGVSRARRVKQPQAEALPLGSYCSSRSNCLVQRIA